VEFNQNNLQELIQLRQKFKEISNENISLKSLTTSLSTDIKFEKDIIIDQLKNESKFKQNLLDTMQSTIEKKDQELQNLKTELNCYHTKLNSTRNELYAANMYKINDQR